MHLIKTALVAGLAALTLTAAAEAATYPSPAFDFAHPGSPHASCCTPGLYSPTGGNLDRPMLVIYASFTDTPFPGGMPASTVASRFFGGFPSVRNYFQDEGGVDLSPAAESEGTANDGVVQVNIASNKDVFGALGIGDQNKQLLQAADPSVNYAAFDTNGDGTITSAELVVERLDADVDALPAGCGATRGHDAVTLDGKAISMAMALDGTDTNLMTIIHETGHTAFGMRDLYGFGVGSFDISGPTCGAADSSFMRTSSWQKLHWGWITPNVVDHDGFVNVPRFDSSKQAYLLYDPDKNTDNYFLVENRQRQAGTYDVSASDNGLVIWRIDDAQYGSGDETIRPIDIMRPDGTRANGCAEYTSGCYSGSSIDAWDPADGSTPQRTMSRTWRDGSGSNVAVRAIGRRRSDNSIRAYFDVRGPGVLVDPYTLDVGGPVNVTPDEGNTISIPVMNTGEATDTFSFTFTGLPAGWTASTVTKTLAAGAGDVANIVLRPTRMRRNRRSRSMSAARATPTRRSRRPARCRCGSCCTRPLSRTRARPAGRGVRERASPQPSPTRTTAMHQSSGCRSSSGSTARATGRRSSRTLSRARRPVREGSPRVIPLWPCIPARTRSRCAGHGSASTRESASSSRTRC